VKFLLGSVAAAVLLAAAPAFAEPPNSAMFLLGGAYSGIGLRGALTGQFEGNYVIGAGYQQFILDADQVSIGIEAGVAGRLGEALNAEAWVGVVGRYDGWTLGPVNIAPAFTFGLSAVTGSMGYEQRQEDYWGGDATLMFYLAPEINLSFVDNPDVEMFARLHHRSGAWGTLGDMEDASNAMTLGLRFKM
jgi:hypothetical protein